MSGLLVIELFGPLNYDGTNNDKTLVLVEVISFLQVRVAGDRILFEGRLCRLYDATELERPSFLARAYEYVCKHLTCIS